MSDTLYVYVGPVVLGKYTAVTSFTTERQCENGHKTYRSNDDFCGQCGSVLKDVVIGSYLHRPTEHDREIEKIESWLTPVLEIEHEGYDVFLPNCGEFGQTISIYSAELSPFTLGTASPRKYLVMGEFMKFFADQIEFLSKFYDEVTIDWGIFPYIR